MSAPEPEPRGLRTRGAVVGRALWRIAWRGGGRRPHLVALPLLGVALGVAAVVAVDLAQRGAMRGFELAQRSVAGQATHRVSGGPEGLDERLYARLRVRAGVREIAPVVQGELRADGERLRLLGVDPFAEGPFRSYFGAAAIGGGGNLESWLLEPGAVLVPGAAAKRLGWRSGQRARVRAGGAEREIQVAGILETEGGGVDDLLICDVSTAQELLGRPGRLSWIDVALPEDPEAAQALRQRIGAEIPPGTRLLPASRGLDSAREMTRAFRLNLFALSLLALAVGGFLIYNALLFAVVSRRELFARLRCLGATRSQILLLVLGEALALGVLGTAGGLALGVVLGRGVLAQVTQTLGDLYFGTQVRHVPAGASSLAIGAALGLGTTLLAALAPAWEAASAAPRDAPAAFRSGGASAPPPACPGRGGSGPVRRRSPRPVVLRAPAGRQPGGGFRADPGLRVVGSVSDRRGVAALRTSVRGALRPGREAGRARDRGVAQPHGSGPGRSGGRRLGGRRDRGHDPQLPVERGELAGRDAFRRHPGRSGSPGHR